MNRLFGSIAILLSIALLVFLSFPIIKILVGTPYESLVKAFGDKAITDSVFLSIKMSFFSTVIVITCGSPFAYFLARHSFPGKSLIESLIDVPVMVPHVAAGIALLMVFGARGIFGTAFKIIGIDFLDTQAGILIAMMFVSAPFFINSAKEGFKKVDVRLEYVSRTLGANTVWTFFKITLPNARKDIVNGALMMWGRGLGEFGAVIILAYHPMTAPVMIYDRFNSFGLSYSLPVAAIMIIISIIIFALIRIINNMLK